MRPISAGFCALLAASCSNYETTSDLDTRQSSLISDGNHNGGIDGFYFLPPLVAAPEFNGAFDPTLSPAIEIRDLTDDGIVALLEGDDIAVDPVAETYMGKWATDDFDLDVNRLYRIAVLLEDRVLGYADVDPVASGREFKSAITNETIPFVDGRSLPIKFRVEAGVLVPVSLELQPFVNGVTRAQGQAFVLASPPAEANATFACQLNGASVPCSPGLPIEWSGLEHGSSVIVDVTVTPGSGILTSATASAIVDDRAPSIDDVNVSGTNGETLLLPPNVIISFVSDDSVANGARFECTLDGEPFECEPGASVWLSVAHGPHSLLISAEDAVGNPHFVTQDFIVDARGPVTTLVRAPGEVTCPDSTDLDEIRFSAVDPVPSSLPLSFKCVLDGAPVSCDLVESHFEVEGAFRWEDLEGGSRVLQVTAMDAFLNAGPPLNVEFEVDRTPPEIDLTLAGDTAVVQLADIGHSPPSLTFCEVLAADGTRVADCTAGCQQLSTTEEGSTWVCSLDGISAGETLRIIAADTCGSVNSGEATLALP